MLLVTWLIDSVIDFILYILIQYTNSSGYHKKSHDLFILWSLFKVQIRYVKICIYIGSKGSASLDMSKSQRGSPLQLTSNHFPHRLEMNLQGWRCDDKIAASGLPVAAITDITGSHCKQRRKQPSVVSKVPAEFPLISSLPYPALIC